MRVLVTGSRDWSDPDLVVAALEAEAVGDPKMVVVHGGNGAGVDAIADRWATERGITVEVHPARWNEEGKRAGPLRNERMVRKGADLCLAFIRDNSRGAEDCARRAQAAGILTNIYREGEQA